MPLTKKVCAGFLCRNMEERALSEFDPEPSMPDGLKKKCRKCVAAEIERDKVLQNSFTPPPKAALDRKPKKEQPPQETDAAMKTCFTCKVSKDLDQFDHAPRAQDRRTNDCTECRKKIGKKKAAPVKPAGAANPPPPRSAKNRVRNKPAAPAPPSGDHVDASIAAVVDRSRQLMLLARGLAEVFGRQIPADHAGV